MSAVEILKTDSVGEVIEEKASFKWTITNFPAIYQAMQTAKSIASPKFKVRMHECLTEWQLLFYPKGDMEINNKFVSIFVKYMGDEDAYVNPSFNILEVEECQDLDDDENNENGSRLGYLLFTPKNKCFGIGRFILQENILNTEMITILCEMFIDRASLYFEKIQKGKVEEIDDYSMLLDNPKLSDVTFLINNGENKLMAHKYWLSKKRLYEKE